MGLQLVFADVLEAAGADRHRTFAENVAEESFQETHRCSQSSGRRRGGFGERSLRSRSCLSNRRSLWLQNGLPSTGRFAGFHSRLDKVGTTECPPHSSGRRGARGSPGVDYASLAPESGARAKRARRPMLVRTGQELRPAGTPLVGWRRIFGRLAVCPPIRYNSRRKKKARPEKVSMNRMIATPAHGPAHCALLGTSSALPPTCPSTACSQQRQRRQSARFS